MPGKPSYERNFGYPRNTDLNMAWDLSIVGQAVKQQLCH